MKPRRTLWPWVPVALLTTMVGGLLVMARIAADDPSFSVERDYYAKAVAWDTEREQQRQNQRLGWKLDLSAERADQGRVQIVARLVDARGRPVERAELEVEAFHNARASEIVASRLNETDAGYRAELPVARAGLWELRFTARRGTDTFTQVVRHDLAPEVVQ